MEEVNQFCPDFVDDQTGILPCNHYAKGGFCILQNYFRCLNYIAIREPNLSYTAVSDYTACHRKFYLSWLLGVESIEKPWAMKLGLFASSILGWLHDEKISSEVAVKRYQTYMNRIIGETMDPEDDVLEYGNVDLWKMKAMFDIYVELGYHQLRGITEYEFRWKFDGLPKLHGFIDLYNNLPVINANEIDHINAENSKGTEAWEFKWTGNANNFSKFLIGDQLSTYFLADPKINCIVNRCFLYPQIYQKKSTKVKVGETILDFFERCKSDIRKNPTAYFYDRKYWRNEFDLDAYKLKIQRVSEEIMSYIKEGKGMDPFYQNKKNCLNPWPCDFLKCCENDIKDPWNLVSAYKKKTPRRK